MSHVPYLVERARWGLRLGHQQFTDAMYRDGFFCPLSELLMGETAENLAKSYKISRREQDEYAVESQRRAGASIQSGRFAQELVAVDVPSKSGEPVTLHTDEHVRMNASIAEMTNWACR